MNFYKNVIEYKGKLLVRGVHNDKEYKEKINFSPTLYSLTKEQTDFKTLQGQNLKPITFQSIEAARRFRRDIATQNSPIYGLERYHYQYINKEFPKQVKWSKDLIKIFTLDIECGCENGFPEVDNPIEELLCISVKNQSNKQIITWGVGKFTTDRTDVTYIECKDEKHLIMEFMKFWLKNYPDVITGWNTKFFDLPYLMNRIKLLVGSKVANRMSPWNLITSEQIIIRGRPNTYYTLYGIAMLDYLDLYKWFIPARQESYRLGFIGEVELGQGKRENPYNTFKDFYTKDFQKFVEYNIQDVEIVDALEDKLGLIDLSLTFAYETKVNYNDIFSQVRVWDTLIANHLMEKNICIPPREEHSKDTKYEGAYVKEPKLGMQHWVVSFDINSLYPHIIVQYNISPEKILGVDSSGVSVNKMLSKKTPLEFLKDKDACITPNGAMFKRDSQGFLPEMIEKIYKDRVIYKKRELKAQREYQKNPTNELKKEIARCHNIQWARKIALNSCYGAIGNQYFRYYDIRMATAVTTSGQLAIRWIENKVNEYLNKLLETTEVDYIIASDTDSIYVRFDELVSKVNPKNPVDFLDKVAKEKIEPYITKCYEELAEYVNAYEQKMEMAREVIADKGIWTAKKRYILNVHDSEGVRYAEPQIKVMGIEAVKSSTPAPCREMIRSALKIIINEDEITLNTFIQAFRENFMKLPPESIAYPRSCNNMKEYYNSSTIFSKGTPMHVKGALVYNYILQREKLTHKYPLIQEGEKIKFLQIRTPNPYQSNVISFMTTLPKEFDLHNMINYDIMFDKSFVEPLTFILEKIGWNVDRSYGTQTTLEHLFA